MNNDIAHNFGAKVDLALPDGDQQHLFLIKTNYPLSKTINLVIKRGGRLLIRGSAWIVVQLAYEQGMRLKQEPGITFVGSVFLDQEKLMAFQRLTAQR